MGSEAISLGYGTGIIGEFEWGWFKSTLKVGDKKIRVSEGFLGKCLQELGICFEFDLPPIKGVRRTFYVWKSSAQEQFHDASWDPTQNILQVFIRALAQARTNSLYADLVKCLKGEGILDQLKKDVARDPRLQKDFRMMMNRFMRPPFEGEVSLETYFEKIEKARKLIFKKNFNGTADKQVNSLVGPVLLGITHPDLVREAALRTPETTPGEHLERWRGINIDAAPKEIITTRSPLKPKYITKTPSETPYENREMRLSSAWAQGDRREMEDAHIAGEVDVFGQKIPFIGLFDGHTGSKTAQYLADNIKNILREELCLLGKPLKQASLQEIENVLSVVTVKAEQERRRTIAEFDFSGATFIMAVVINDAVWSVNAGDSRILALQGNITYQLTEDANPVVERFKRGVGKRRGYVSHYGRVGGYLATARAIGDESIQGVSPRSKVTRFPLSSENPTTLIMGCDGLFECASSRQIAEEYKEKLTAGDLVQKSYTSGSHDNISSMVLTIPSLTK